MLSRLFVIFIFLFCRALLPAQADSVKYVPGQKMEDGIYLSHKDLRRNSPIKKEQIVSAFDKEQLEFVAKVMFEQMLVFKLGDSTLTIPTKNAWGYVQNNTFYVNYEGDFYRIPVFGSISYLVANVTVLLSNNYDPRFGYTGSGTGKELREFLINYYDGKPKEYHADYFEELLACDKELLAEYKNLKKRHRKDQLYLFIRKFNERHPVYFLR